MKDSVSIQVYFALSHCVGIGICLLVRPCGWILSYCVYVELYTLVESSLEIIVHVESFRPFSLPDDYLCFFVLISSLLMLPLD